MRPVPAALRAALVLPALLASCTCDGAPVKAAWRTLQPGLAYTRIDRGDTTYHVVRADLATHELAVADARRQGRKVAPVSTLREEVGALVAVNCTFFDERQRPLGLVVSAGTELNPLRKVRWWAAFVVRGGSARPVAEILTTDQILKLAPGDRGAIAFAVQVGPRTVVGGRPLKLKPQTAARSALGITNAGEVLLLATEGNGVESNDLAAFMASSPSADGLGCQSGLMLDGGPSTQLSIKTEGFALDVPGGYGVPNAVVVTRRARR